MEALPPSKSLNSLCLCLPVPLTQAEAATASAASENLNGASFPLRARHHHDHDAPLPVASESDSPRRRAGALTAGWYRHVPLPVAPKGPFRRGDWEEPGWAPCRRGVAHCQRRGPARAGNFPGGGLGKAERCWQGCSCSCGSVRCCGGHRSCSYWDTVCVRPVGLDRIRHRVLRGTGSWAPWAWLTAGPLAPAGSTDE